MNTISPELINEIRSSVDIVDVISSYIELSPKGRNFFGVCPFHDDTHPSMSVSKEKQIYTCFSCHATGNVFKFLMDYENISFVEAVKKCADMANIKLDVKVNSFDNVNNKYKELYDIYDQSCKFYQNLINTKDGLEAKEYLHNRGIDENLIKEFKIGLSLKERDLLTKFLIKNKHSKEDIVKCGLILDNNYGVSDIYSNRIMFPLEDLTGKVVGFSGRIYNTTDNSKYINTKETEIFKKRELMYNYHRAKDDARTKGYVIVMEGFMDVIRAYSVGIKNCVATMGTAITSNHANILKRMAKNIYLCFDGDSAGLKATLSCIEELDKVGVIPQIIRLEDNLDPDEYIIKYGKDKFLEKIDNAMDIMDFKMAYLKQTKDITKIEDKTSYVEEVLKELSNFDNEIKKEITLKKLSFDSGLDIEFLKEELSKIDIKNEPKKEVEKKVEPRKTGLEKAEIYLLYYMLKNKDIIRMYEKKLGFMPDSEYRILAREITSYYKDNNSFELADFLTYLSSYPNILDTLSKVLSSNLKDEYKIEDIEGYIHKINNAILDDKIDKLKHKLDETTDVDKQAEILSQMRDLKNKKIES